MRYLALISLFVYCATSVGAQSYPRSALPIQRRAFEPRIIVGGGLGFQAARLVETNLPEVRTTAWLGPEFELGASLTAHDRWGADLQGTWAYQGHMLWIDTLCYPVSIPQTRVEFRLWHAVRTSFLDDWDIKVGVSGGYSFQNSGEKSRNDAGFHTVTTYPALTSPFIAPEVGLWQETGSDRMELVVRYQQQLFPATAYTSVASSPEGYATYSGTHNNLGFLFRYHIGIPKKGPLIPERDWDYVDRRTDTLSIIDTKWSGVTLVLWDDAEHDGDTVSVLLNGEVMLDHFELTPERSKLFLPLKYQDNTVVIVAHNEGRVPPNTARAFIRTGHGRHWFLFKTTTTRNAAVGIRRR